MVQKGDPQQGDKKVKKVMENPAPFYPQVIDKCSSSKMTLSQTVQFFNRMNICDLL